MLGPKTRRKAMKGRGMRSGNEAAAHRRRVRVMQQRTERVGEVERKELRSSEGRGEERIARFPARMWQERELYINGKRCMRIRERREQGGHEDKVQESPARIGRRPVRPQGKGCPDSTGTGVKRGIGHRGQLGWKTCRGGRPGGRDARTPPLEIWSAIRVSGRATKSGTAYGILSQHVAQTRRVASATSIVKATFGGRIPHGRGRTPYSRPFRVLSKVFRRIKTDNRWNARPSPN
ncbi:hypothetical protein DFH06DRAFT_1117921 [Mycena polygramma]|nr:hypothetical protein DFH06DRAFT_1117921 [Mycena polygramma]